LCHLKKAGLKACEAEKSHFSASSIGVIGLWELKREWKDGASVFKIDREMPRSKCCDKTKVDIPNTNEYKFFHKNQKQQNRFNACLAKIGLYLRK